MVRPPSYATPPIVGALFELQANPLAFMERVSQLGDVVRVRIANRRAVMVNHPDYAEHVLVKHHGLFSKQTRGYQMLREALGNGLLTSEGTFWRRQRRIAQPAFHRRVVNGFVPRMVAASEHWAGIWRESAKRGETRDVASDMMALTLRIVGECLLSQDLSVASDRVGQALTTMLHGAIKRIQNPLTLPLWVPTPRNRVQKAAIAELDEVVMEVVRKRRAAPQQEEDLLDLLLHTADADTGERMTDQQLRDELLTIVLAGHETTANALAWSWALLSKNPAIRRETQVEVDRVLADEPTITIELLKQLEFTEAVFKESMRLYPPVWAVARCVEEEHQMGPYTLLKGEMIFLSTWVSHRDRRFWPDPLAFTPERFINAPADRPKMAYFPFLAGPRQCIGAAFAMMEAKIILATMLKEFDADLAFDAQLAPEPTITLRPRDGVKMSIASRRAIT